MHTTYQYFERVHGLPNWKIRIWFAVGEQIKIWLHSHYFCDFLESFGGENVIGFYDTVIILFVIFAVDIFSVRSTK